VLSAFPHKFANKGKIATFNYKLAVDVGRRFESLQDID
jgi:hypothetical protein